MLKKILFFLLAISLFATCTCNESSTENNKDNDTLASNGVQIDEKELNDIIQSFSSPVEMAAAIQDMDVAFSTKYLVPTDKVDDYDTNFKKALGLGVLSADLGYLNVYGKTSLIIDYITVIKRVADDLRVGQFFDFQTLKRLATNNENLDSLMFLSINSYHLMDEHLRNNNRSNLSALVVTAVWLEGLYLATQVTKEKYNEKLADRIGEQKTILNNLVAILKVFNKDPNFANLVSEFGLMQQAYEKIKITYEVGKSEAKEIDGHLVIIQKDVSKVEMTKEQLDNIIVVTEKVRNKLIAL